MDTKRKVYSRDVIEQAALLYNSGESSLEICEKLGIKKSLLDKWIITHSNIFKSRKNKWSEEELKIARMIAEDKSSYSAKEIRELIPSRTEAAIRHKVNKFLREFIPEKSHKQIMSEKIKSSDMIIRHGFCQNVINDVRCRNKTDGKFCVSCARGQYKRDMSYVPFNDIL